MTVTMIDEKITQDLIDNINHFCNLGFRILTIEINENEIICKMHK